MKINSAIYNYMLENNNMITTSKVVELGFSKAILTNYVKEGLIERVRQGQYILPDAIHDDMYTLSKRSDNIIFSHDTALFLLGLSERTPFVHSVTIPSSTSLPQSIKYEVECYYIKPELHSIGVIDIKTTFGNNVRCYNMERTICDVLRSRSRLDDEVVITALKLYAKHDKKDLNLLSKYAKDFKVIKVLMKYMEVLL